MPAQFFLFDYRQQISLRYYRVWPSSDVLYIAVATASIARKYKSNSARKLRFHKPHDVLKEHCLHAWRHTESTTRKTPLLANLLYLPPSLLLSKPKDRLLSLNWLFHRFPSKPSEAKQKNRLVACSCLDTMHRLVSKTLHYYNSKCSVEPLLTRHKYPSFQY